MKWLLAIVACALVVPYAHEVANATRIVKGFGGEMFIPLLPVIGSMVDYALKGDNDDKM